MSNNSKKYIPIDKQSKKSQREYNAAQRTLISFNTGTRVHKTDKHPCRARAKHLARTNNDD